MNAFFVCLILYFAVSPTWGQLDEQTIQNFDWNKDSAFIDQLFERYDGICPGASFLVIKDGTVVAKKAYGYADLKNRVKTTLHSNFRLASASKQFTAMAILQLVHQKKLRLDQAITSIFEDFPEYGANITVQHLLRHRSGLVDYMNLLDQNRSTQILDAEVLTMMKAQDSTLFKPGSKCLYSNSAYAILAMIIEKISGQSFAEYMKKELFEPLGMMQTSVYEQAQAIENRAFGYTKVGHAFRMTDQSTSSAVQGDGGIYTSVLDYQKWAEALFSNQLVPLTFFEQSLVPYNDPPDYRYQAYGSGWRCDYLNGLLCTHHSGHTKGFTNYTLRIPALKISVVVLSNRNNEDAVIYIGNMLAALFSESRLTVYDVAYIDAVYEKQGSEAALKLYKKLSANPSIQASEKTLLVLGQKLQKEQQFLKAVEVYLEQIKVFPHAHEAYYQLAACYTALGQQQQAKQMQQLALDKIPATYRKVLRP